METMAINKGTMPLRRRIAYGSIFILFILFMASLVFIIVPAGIGYFHEGIIGYVSDIVLRFFVVVIVGTLLAFGYFYKEKWQHTVIWWICLVIACAGSFFLLKAPLLDLPYIAHPASLNLDYVTFEMDNNREYAIMYKVQGYTASNDIKVFEIDSHTYDTEKEKWKPQDNISADITYLPHTDVLMELKTYESN